MILQYCLSVYGVHYLLKPNFTTFIIRIVNQQNGDCSDSKLMNTNQLDSHTFPVMIKIKGGDRLLLKIKIISLTKEQSEICIGEGVIGFHKSQIDDTKRIPIYDKKQGVEEIAICTLDLLISGFSIDKNISGALDKSKSKIEDWRDHSEDAVYSQMSYTVQSETEEPKKDNQRQQTEASNKINTKNLKIFTPNSQQGLDKDKNGLGQQAPLRALRNTLNDGPSEAQNINILDNGQSSSSQAQNSDYLSDLSEKKFVPLRQIPASSRSKKNKQTIVQIEPQKQIQIIRKKQTNDDPIAPQMIKKLSENQHLMEKLKQYLQKNENQQAQKNQVKLPKNKFRRKTVVYEELSAYKPENKFLKYYKEFTNAKIFANYNVTKCLASEIDSSSDVIRDGRDELQILNITFYSVNDQKIVSFDALAYRSYCQKIKTEINKIDIKLPEDQKALKVVLALSEHGEFECLLGTQEGKSMLIKLTSLPRNKQLFTSFLTKEQFQLNFDIKKPQKTSTKANSPPQRRQNPNVSLQEQEEHQNTGDIRARVKSLNGQPWGYGYSHLGSIQKSPSPLVKSNPQRQKLSASIKSHTESNQVITPFCPNQADSSLNLGEQSASIENTSFLQADSSDLSFKHSFVRQNTKKNDLKEIKRIRNGNRNNYKFKDRKDSSDSHKSPQAKIKEMWERLLIKKKIQEEQIEKKEMNSTRKQLQSVFHNNKKKSSYLPSHEARIRNKLYSHVAGTREVIKVRPNREKQQKGPLKTIYPLRTLTIEINNISITQPQLVVDDDADKSVGKFVKFQVKNKVTYYTQIIFNGQFNSILWKLSGCLFKELSGSERLQIQVYKTLQNKISLIGRSSIRVNKLHFLKNNHIYNGKIICEDTITGQFTLSFDVSEQCPFQVIKEQQQRGSRLKKYSSVDSRMRGQTKQLRQSQPSYVDRRLPPAAQVRDRIKQYREEREDLGFTRKKSAPKRQDQRRLLIGQSRLVVDTMGQEEQESEQLMPQGLTLQSDYIRQSGKVTVNKES